MVKNSKILFIIVTGLFVVSAMVILFVPGGPSLGNSNSTSTTTTSSQSSTSEVSVADQLSVSKNIVVKNSYCAEGSIFDANDNLCRKVTHRPSYGLNAKINFGVQPTFLATHANWVYWENNPSNGVRSVYRTNLANGSKQLIGSYNSKIGSVYVREGVVYKLQAEIVKNAFGGNIVGSRFVANSDGAHTVQTVFKTSLPQYFGSAGYPGTPAQFVTDAYSRFYVQIKAASTAAQKQFIYVPTGFPVAASTNLGIKFDSETQLAGIVDKQEMIVAQATTTNGTTLVSLKQPTLSDTSKLLDLVNINIGTVTNSVITPGEVVSFYQAKGANAGTIVLVQGDGGQALYRYQRGKYLSYKYENVAQVQVGNRTGYKVDISQAVTSFDPDTISFRIYDNSVGFMSPSGVFSRVSYPNLFAKAANKVHLMTDSAGKYIYYPILKADKTVTLGRLDLGADDGTLVEIIDREDPFSTLPNPV